MKNTSELKAEIKQLKQENSKLKAQLLHEKNNIYDFQKIADNLNIGIFIKKIKEESSILYVNKKATDIFNIPQKLFLNQDNFKLLPKRFVEIIKKTEGIVINTKKVFSSIEKIHSQDRMNYYKYSITPYFDNDGEVTHLINSVLCLDDIYELQQELHIQNKKFENLIQNMPGVVYITKKEYGGTISFISENSKSIFGKSASSLLGKKLISFIDNADIPHINKNIEYAIKNNKEYSIHYRMRISTNLIYVWEKGKPVFDDNMNLLYFEGVIIDVTHKTLMENMLRQTQKKIKTILDVFPDTILILDSEGKYIDVHSNNGIANFCDSSIIGKNIFNILPDSIANITLEKINNVLNTKIDETINFQIDTQEGIQFCEGTMVDMGNNHVLQTLRNITERVNIQQALDKSNLIYKTILEEANDRIAIIDMKYNILYINNMFFESLGYSYREYINIQKEPNFLFNNEFNYAYKAMQEGNTIYDYTVKDKNENILFYNAKVVRIKNPNVTSSMENDLLLIVARDISYIKEYEQELIEAKESAEKHNKLKTSFLANMSHDIRTPMNAIIGFSQLLAESEMECDKKELFASLIKSNSELMLNLVNDIIDIAKIEAGKFVINISELILNNNIRIIFNNYNQLFKKQNISQVKLISKFNLSDKLSIIKADENRLIQIFSNLLNNAMKFTQEGYIEFGYEDILLDGKFLVLYVKDTGMGITKESIEKIFQEYGQADENISKNFGGTGLGLYISKNLVELMGGKMWVESTIDVGTTFFFSIPLANPIVYKVKSTQYKLGEKKYNNVYANKTIIIADSNMDSFKYVKAILKNTGIHCIYVSNSIDLIKTINKREKIDMLFLDIQLPSFNFVETINNIKNIKPKLPIVTQYSFDDINNLKTYKTLGANEIICKPLKYENLLTIFEKYFKF